MGNKSSRLPFSRDEWTSWRDRSISLESEIRESAIHAGFAYGPIAEDRGKRIERDLRAYREYVAKLAQNKMADVDQFVFNLEKDGD